MSKDNEFSLDSANREEVMAALFANLVMQQTNMAMIFLGAKPHPETGATVRELETAKFFIDQLEMIEVKTKGNLDKREEGLLKQSLMGLRMAFVEAVEKNDAQKPLSQNEKPSSDGAPTSTAPASEAAPASADKPADDDSRKKFSKKY